MQYIKRGYSRVAQIAAFDVRRGDLTPEEARVVGENDGQRLLMIYFLNT